MSLYNFNNSVFYCKLKQEYQNYLNDINSFISLAKSNTMIYYIDDKNNIFYINESKVLNRDFINSAICSLSIILEDKALFDFAYAIELYCKAKELSKNPLHQQYGNELYKPVAQLLFSTIDHYVQKYGYSNNINQGTKNYIDEIFLNILRNNINANNGLSLNQVKLLSYYFAKMIYMFDNENWFKQIHQLTNRNCILHNSILINNSLEIPEVTDNETLNLIAMFINIMIICNFCDTNNSIILSTFVQSLVS